VNRREIGDSLALYIDRLIYPVASPGRDPTRHEQIQGLLALADHLQAILVPVEPDANYRRRLHGDLILEAQRRQSEPDAGLFQQHRKGIVIGAVIGSVASVMGVIVAFVLRYRHGRAPHGAAG
jgi:hypothetical protein